MIIVDYSTDGPLLKDCLNRTPEAKIKIEEQYQKGKSAHYIFWVEGGDLRDFEVSLEEDPSISNSVLLTELETRRLYRVTTTKEIHETATHPDWGELGLVFFEGKGTHEGWTFQVGLPDRESLAEFRRLHHDRGRPFKLNSIYHESKSQDGIDAQLTDSQKETLIAAYEAEYFDVPQNATQTDVADQLDVSPQAVSERLHRGIQTLSK